MGVALLTCSRLPSPATGAIPGSHSSCISTLKPLSLLSHRRLGGRAAQTFRQAPSALPHGTFAHLTPGPGLTLLCLLKPCSHCSINSTSITKPTMILTPVAGVGDSENSQGHLVGHRVPWRSSPLGWELVLGPWTERGSCISGHLLAFGMARVPGCCLLNCRPWGLVSCVQAGRSEGTVSAHPTQVWLCLCPRPSASAGRGSGPQSG